jgi:hypothetical protein
VASRLSQTFNYCSNYVSAPPDLCSGRKLRQPLSKWRSEARAHLQALPAKIYFYLTRAAVGEHASVHPVFPALFAFFCGNSSGFYSLSDPKLPA